LNRGLEDIALKTGYLVSKSSVNTQEDVSELSYPTNAVFVTDVYYAGARLGKLTRGYLDDNVDDWQGAIGAPLGWFSDKGNVVTLYPVPDAVYAVILYYVSTDDALSDDSDVPHLPSAFHIALCYYACREMATADAQGEKAAYCGGKYKEILTSIYKTKQALDNARVSGLVKPSMWSS